MFAYLNILSEGSRFGKSFFIFFRKTWPKAARPRKEQVSAPSPQQLGQDVLGDEQARDDGGHARQ